MNLKCVGLALLLSLSIPAMATEVTVADASDLRSIAYMNLDTADEQTRTNILVLGFHDAVVSLCCFLPSHPPAWLPAISAWHEPSSRSV